MHSILLNFKIAKLRMLDRESR